jgi:hypothetical protein
MKKRLKRGMGEREEGEGKTYRREWTEGRGSHGRIEWRLLRWSADGGGVGIDKCMRDCRGRLEREVVGDLEGERYRRRMWTAE